MLINKFNYSLKQNSLVPYELYIIYINSKNNKRKLTMPWDNKNEGGGPWGKSGPWGNKNGNGGGNWGGKRNSEDLDEILKKGGEKISKLFPRGPRGFFFGGLILFIFWILSGFYTIGPEEQGVVLRFGKYSSTQYITKL